MRDISVFEPPRYYSTTDKQSSLFVFQVDIASDGMVDWDEFCTYMMIQFKEHDVTTNHGKGSFNPKMNIARIAHNKETTTRILKDFNPMRYVTVSKVTQQPIFLFSIYPAADPEEARKGCTPPGYQLWAPILKITNTKCFLYLILRVAPLPGPTLCPWFATCKITDTRIDFCLFFVWHCYGQVPLQLLSRAALLNPIGI